MSQWMTAGLAIGGGVVVGTVAGWAARRLVGRRMGDGAGQVAGPTGTFLFWFFTFLGIVIGLSVLTPATLETLPRQVLGFLPRVLAAGLILLGAWAVASLVGRLVRSGLVSASGEHHRGLETAVRAAVIVTGFVFAIAQLGVDTTILTILVGVVGASLGLAFALLVGLGGRTIAAEVAAGRYLARHLREGDLIVHDGQHLHVETLHPASIEATQPDGRRRVIRYSSLMEDGFVSGG